MDLPDRKYFWIPLVIAFWTYIMVSTTPFEIVYHSIGISFIAFNIWLTLLVGAPKILAVMVNSKYDRRS